MQTVHIDGRGRLTRPHTALKALGVGPDDDVTGEVTTAGVLIRPKRATPITDRIAAMSLPVSDWEAMEREIEAGRHASGA